MIKQTNQKRKKQSQQPMPKDANRFAVFENLQLNCVQVTIQLLQQSPIKKSCLNIPKSMIKEDIEMLNTISDNYILIQHSYRKGTSENLNSRYTRRKQISTIINGLT